MFLSLHGSVVSFGIRIRQLILMFLLVLDAALFYHLESWISNPAEPSTTHFITQMELFQRQITTAAFKLAGGVELSSSALSKPTKQNPIPQAFITKITKAFLDSLYAFLDGLVLLASDESPIVAGKRTAVAASTSSSSSSNPIDLLDLGDSVCPTSGNWETDNCTNFQPGHPITHCTFQLGTSFGICDPEHGLTTGECLRYYNR